MVKLIFFLIQSICALTVCYCHADSIKEATPFTINVHNHLNQTGTTTASARSNQIQETAVQATASITKSVRDVCDNAKKEIQQNGHQLIDAIKKYKLRIFGSIVISIYCALLYRIIRYNHFLNSNDLWGVWRNDLSYEQLQMVPAQDLAQGLILEIQRRYINHADPTNFVTPLTEFLSHIDREIGIIKEYNRYISLCNRLRISFLIPCNKEKEIQAAHLLLRAQFIKHIFISWAASYNLTV